MTPRRRGILMRRGAWFAALLGLERLLATLLGRPLLAELTGWPLLHGVDGDTALFQPGGVALVESLRTAGQGLSEGARFLLLSVVLAHVLLGPPLALLSTSLLAHRSSPWRCPHAGAWLRLVPRAYLLEALGWLGLGVLALTWYVLASTLTHQGYFLLGEFGHDLAQLGLFVGLGLGAFCLRTLVDLSRATLAKSRASVGASLATALELVAQRPLGLFAQAGWRLGMAWLLPVSAWLLGASWLVNSSGTPTTWQPATTLLAAQVAALGLRLSWIQVCLDAHHRRIQAAPREVVALR